MAVLLQAADIIEAMRSESARLSAEDRDLSQKNRLASVRSLHSRDNSVISMTGSADKDVQTRANGDWQAVTADWERELESIQSDLFRSKSPELATLQVWALSRLAGGEGFRSGVNVLIAMFESFAKDEPPERWEMLGSIDTGEREDVLPRTLGRGGFLGGPMTLGGATSIDRVLRHSRGEPDPTVEKALEQEFSALTDEQVRAVEAIGRESAELVLALRNLATAAGVADAEKLLQASRDLMFNAAKIVRAKAPEQFPPERAPEIQAGAAASGGAPRVDFAASEEGYIAARERKFRELEAIGTWFRRFEPHNPIGHVVPPLLKRAGLDLPGLFAEVLSAAGFDTEQRGKLFRYLATKDPEAKADESSSGS